jgi:hypothetical protein
MSNRPKCEVCKRREATREQVWPATGERVWMCDTCYRDEGELLRELGFKE